MTIHRLTKPGSKRTACSLNVPAFMAPLPDSTTWEDGDEGGGKQCDEGCWEADPHADRLREMRAVGERATVALSAPSAPRPLQRFDVMTTGPKGTTLCAGFAIVNRDGSVSVSLDSLPIDGKLRLVPKEGG